MSELSVRQYLHNDGSGFTLGYDKSEVDAVITELKSEIDYVHGVEQRWFERCMEARAENVRLKRALWLARAMRADDAAHWTVYVTYMHYHENSFYAFDGDDIFHHNNKNLDGFKLWCSKWETVKVKCLKKAKEYK